MVVARRDLTALWTKAQAAYEQERVHDGQLQEAKEQKFLATYGPDLEAMVSEVLGEDVDLSQPAILGPQLLERLWPRTDSGGPSVAVVDTASGILFTVSPDLPSAARSGFYAHIECPKCGRYRSRLVNALRDLGELIGRECGPCSHSAAAQADLPAVTKRETMLAELRYPVPAVAGGSDSDNLAAIAHNLGVISRQIYGFFDCGASMAGRGV